ncbi:hypothetical protein C7Y66_10950 [Chroococcidiopsis sp. CCALA 051]|uniref:hypothetical protein n=1 Tax=Chroococcidiopsis sp. CCALA 051 TaxID=869949 RepID=UPI000D0E0C01|nr:hypothetical protein [Chroococcidiopsis sp. CCALA 051]MBE9015831.1 hypothetical protein [Chroococcidiopsidales cyanobacterium LEGE 13417]PSM49131.1 hypothetical protein C7Y66_10950 [Chroococcidiopsis sp. CCALA 051]
MAKTKYTPERVEIILAAIRQEGGDRAGWEAGEINENTFYEWLRKHGEFAQGVAQAKQEYQRNCPTALKRQAKRSLAEYLFQGTTETWETTEILEDGCGNVKLVKRSTKTVRRGPPQWAIERVLGERMHELECVKVLVESGWLPESTVEKIATKLKELNETARAAIQTASEEGAGETAPTDFQTLSADNLDLLIQ